MKLVLKAIKLIVIFIISQSQIGQIAAQCHMDDWTALKALYESTDGDNWTNNNGWSQVTGTTPPANCNLGGMHRVILDGNGRVSKLLLFSNQLVGNIPTEIGGLSELIDLTLSSNDLSGPIPSELETLGNLTNLNLASNELTGDIPVELGNLSNLEVLQLSLNQLSGSIPSELEDLDNLVNLNLRSNQLTGNIPEELGNLSSLEILALGINQLSGPIPIELGDLNSLTSLSLYSNQLSGNIPAELGNLNSLELLWMYDNQLTGNIPPDIGDLSALTSLRLNVNQLTGDIPTDIGSLSNLTELYLNTNQFIGSIPPVLGSLSNLVSLRLNSNQLTGCYDSDLTILCTQLNDSRNVVLSSGNNFDADWEDFCLNGMGACIVVPQTELDYLALRALYLCTDGDNWTSQTDGNAEWPSASDFMSNPTTPAPGFEDLGFWYGIAVNGSGHVDDINLADNNLVGCIPAELGELTNMQYLELNNNQLTGSIPTELGNLSQLMRLYLYNNQLSGNIPNSFGNLTKLSQLNLSTNQLTGNIPVEIGNLSKLTYLILYANQLTGPIPSGIGFLTQLELLGLMDNQLTGTIPIELGYLGNLIELGLSGNQLTGTIPTEFGNLHNVVQLDLSSNQLTGSIPGGLGNLTSLEILVLKNNGLGGCIDESFWRLCADRENIDISEGNNIDYETYCETGAGSCLSPPPSVCEMNEYPVLRALYLSTDGDNWFDNSGWPTAAEFLMHPTSAPPGSAPLSTWHGVSLNAGGCVLKLNLGSNNLSGPLPISIGNLSYLTELWLDNNKLSGKIPTSIGDLTNLYLLWLKDNFLIGQIPVGIGNLELTFLELQNNNLNGCYDSNLSKLCTQLPVALDTWMSDGNNFIATWEDFCDNGTGECDYDQEIPDDRICDWSKAGLVSEFCHPQKFINIVDDHQADDTGVEPVDEAVRMAIASADENGAIIFFPPGTYNFQDSIVLKSGIVLKGAGAGQTTLHAELDEGYDFIVAHGEKSPNNSVSLTNDAPRFQDYIEVDDHSTIEEGDYLKLDFEDNYLLLNSWGSVGQIVLVTSKETNGRLNLHSPLRREYIAGETDVYEYDMIKNVGVECLRIFVEDEIDKNGYNISFKYAAESWVNAIDSDKCNKAHIAFDQSAFCQVSGSYIHDAHHFGTGGKAYGVELEAGASDIKVENNTFETLRHSILVQGGANGNVIAYNFSHSPNLRVNNSIFFFDEGGVFNNLTADLVCHGNYPYLNLFEGNIHHYVNVDMTHGNNGPYNTFFRNRQRFRRGIKVGRREEDKTYSIAVILAPLTPPIVLWEETYFRAINDSVNIVGNEVSLKGRGSNYNVQGEDHFEYGNHVDEIWGVSCFFCTSRDEPDGTDDLTDISYYLDPSDRPAFLDDFQLPIIGYPNDMNDFNNPAFDRFDIFGQTVDSCIPDCPPNRVIDENDILPSGTYAAKNTIFFNGSLEQAANVTFCAGINVEVGDLFEIELAQTFKVVIKGCAEP